MNKIEELISLSLGSGLSITSGNTSIKHKHKDGDFTVTLSGREILFRIDGKLYVDLNNMGSKVLVSRLNFILNLLNSKVRFVKSEGKIYFIKDGDGDFTLALSSGKFEI